jgi:hypothetical protein
MDNKSEPLEERAIAERIRMEEVFGKLVRKDNGHIADEFLSMAENYFKDSKYFFGEGDIVRAFEAVVISWSYIDAGIKAGFFSVPEELREYFTS